jgi:hypothetical protein
MLLTHIGTVVDFDEPRGIGEVEDEMGKRHGFHCTAIADGSRNVGVGESVAYAVRPGRSGRWEAESLVPVRPTSPEGSGPADPGVGRATDRGRATP